MEAPPYRPERWKGFREDYRFTGKEEDVEVGLVEPRRRPFRKRRVVAALHVHEAGFLDPGGPAVRNDLRLVVGKGHGGPGKGRIFGVVRELRIGRIVGDCGADM